MDGDLASCEPTHVAAEVRLGYMCCECVSWHTFLSLVPRLFHFLERDGDRPVPVGHAYGRDGCVRVVVVVELYLVKCTVLSCNLPCGVLRCRHVTVWKSKSYVHMLL